MLMLSMQIDQSVSKFFQESDLGRRVVNERTRASSGEEFTSQNKFISIIVPVGLQESMDAIVAARADMIADLDRMRHMLEDLGNGMGITHAVSGVAVAEPRGTP